MQLYEAHLYWCFQKNATKSPTKNGIIYDEASLHEALEMMKNDMSVQKAVKEKLIPRETLITWVTNRTSKHGRGKRPVFTHEEEEPTVVVLEYCSALVWSCASEEIAEMVKSYFDSMKKQTKFRNNLPGED